jgi:hypothetical protein
VWLWACQLGRQQRGSTKWVAVQPFRFLSCQVLSVQSLCLETTQLILWSRHIKHTSLLSEHQKKFLVHSDTCKGAQAGMQ